MDQIPGLVKEFLSQRKWQALAALGAGVTAVNMLVLCEAGQLWAVKVSKTQVNHRNLYELDLTRRVSDLTKAGKLRGTVQFCNFGTIPDGTRVIRHVYIQMQL